jgi:hypothetical protein
MTPPHIDFRLKAEATSFILVASTSFILVASGFSRKIQRAASSEQRKDDIFRP